MSIICQRKKEKKKEEESVFIRDSKRVQGWRDSLSSLSFLPFL
jgi:hypothetical protein